MDTTENTRSREISWDVEDIAVYGTLTEPEGGGPYPGVVFVAGSGPTDRDWTTPLLPGSNGSARLLAEALAEAGFVTLRYDKRASGPHVRENMERLAGKVSMEGHRAELAGAVDSLAGRDDVDRDHLFALTNSEGAIHALNYQLQDPPQPLAGLVLTAPPGRPVGDLARSQIAAQMATVPDGDRWLARYDEAIAAFSAGQPMTVDDSLPQVIKTVLGALAVPANLPFVRELWVANPSAMIAQVAVPTLIVIGRRDIQVDWQADGGYLQAATAGQANVSFEFPEHANHVLKYEARPREELVPAEVSAAYNAGDRRLDPDALDAIRAWLLAHGRRPA